MFAKWDDDDGEQMVINDDYLKIPLNNQGFDKKKILRITSMSTYIIPLLGHCIATGMQCPGIL